jgi:DNA-binding protein HU-beta
VLIPEENEKDLTEIPANIREGLEIVTVAHVDEVLIAFLFPFDSCCPPVIRSSLRGRRRTSLSSRGSGEMNKQELISQVADSTGLSRGDALRAVEAVFDTISGALKRGDEVRLVGFGTFTCSRRKASTGRNPRTGEPMQIKESTQPKFKAGKGLKDSVNA